jgi:carbon monoxide dehydrogenase subunit G
VAQQRREFLTTDRSPLDVMARLRIAMKQNDSGETVLSTQTSATFYATGLMPSLFGKNVTVTAIPEGMDTRLIVLADVMLGSPAELLDQVAKIASEEVVLEEV